MPEQDTLLPDGADPAPFNVFDHHIWKRFIADGGLFLNTLAWNRARAEGEFVGTCRNYPNCGGFLRPEPTGAVPDSPDDAMVWYGASCTRCDHEIWAPDGKVLQRSARHSQMPRTYLRTRAGVIAAPRSEGG